MESLIIDKWNQYLELFPTDRRDTYYFEEYAKLYDSEESKALCAVCIDKDKCLMMPFIRKKIDSNHFDFETPYGYGGPLSNCDDEIWIDKALQNMSNLFLNNGYICGFIRFHPLLNNAFYCKKHINVLYDRQTVAIDTSKNEEDIWMYQISSKNRNMIRKAAKNGLVYNAEFNYDSISQFVDLYNSTMNRLGADSFYYFDDMYYKDFVKMFSNRAFLGTIAKDDKIICSALFMFSGRYGHYHLEGSDYAYSSLAANNLLLWESAKVMKNLGVKEFHLGGGYDSAPDNSLLKFKKSFSKNFKDFYIGKWVFDNEYYEKLKNEWMLNNPDKVGKYEKLLLCYRY